MLIDRSYSPEEIALLAAKAEAAFGALPEIVQLTAHLAAASARLDAALAVGPLAPEFAMVGASLRAASTLFLLVCQQGPLTHGKPQ